MVNSDGHLDEMNITTHNTTLAERIRKPLNKKLRSTYDVEYSDCIEKTLSFGAAKQTHFDK